MKVDDDDHIESERKHRIWLRKSCQMTAMKRKPFEFWVWLFAENRDDARSSWPHQQHEPILQFSFVANFVDDLRWSSCVWIWIEYTHFICVSVSRSSWSIRFHSDVSARLALVSDSNLNNFIYFRNVHGTASARAFNSNSFNSTTSGFWIQRTRVCVCSCMFSDFSVMGTALALSFVRLPT